MSNPGSLVPALVLRVPDETGVVRLEVSERLLNAVGGNSVWVSQNEVVEKIPFLSLTAVSP